MNLKKITVISLFLFFVISTAVVSAGFLAEDRVDKQEENIVKNEGKQFEETILSIEMVANHSARDDCWMIIDGKVYDITSYFGMHPGGNVTMVDYCGNDGGDAYKTKDQANPRDHSDYAKKMLEDYYVGDVGSTIKVSVVKNEVDSDLDGISDFDELNVYNTDPNNIDSDNDGYSDGEEIENGYNPNSEGLLDGNNSGKILVVSPQNNDNGLISVNELSRHGLKDDCWLVIDGKVYDITHYFGMHPGGDGVMVGYCGKDGSSAFSTKGKPNPSNHSVYAYNLLVTYYMGELDTGKGYKKQDKVKNEIPETYITYSTIANVVLDNSGELIYEIERKSDNTFVVKYILGDNHYEAITDYQGNVLSAVNKGSINLSKKLQDISMHNYSLVFDSVVSKINSNYAKPVVIKIEPKVGHNYVVKFKEGSNVYEALVDMNGLIAKISNNH